LFAWSNMWNMLWTVLQFLAKLESRISMEHMEPRMSVCIVCISSFWTWRILWSHSKSWILRCEGPQHISMPNMPRTASNFSKMLKGGRMSLWRLAFKRTMFQAKMWHFAKTFLGHGLLLCTCAALAGHDSSILQWSFWQLPQARVRRGLFGGAWVGDHSVWGKCGSGFLAWRRCLHLD